ncbi:NADH-ubiquinone oxidoreductase chain 4L [Methanococcus vannielii SB]|jgi:energy-converting hydrogenase B subunit E|uniref:NADH-ubiquinone oxidoreductase chain 4L n=1 Tax=Methanococcus vannielii (strain ATCC 35089 / DSM 1224 / JCM 13029 / OCM 148 / SB) TaxID=406327 RepID=A6UQS0_METVS|nr:cation:proton antiporter subunit C [Methanococcus vannielii]ABR54842.1 NADH-ubiquinone oxidoreductase chain 4L [Methanococcus vannielii SB]
MDLQLASFITAGILIVIGLYGTFFVDNVIKKIIALSALGNGVNLTLIAIGYTGGIVPIKAQEMELALFSMSASYPLPQALVLTNIVIEASMLAIMLGLSIVFYKKYKTLKSSELLKDD